MADLLGIKLRTLTPIWTGGVDQTCDRLHETGIIGSLRWWYEALVRGLGGYACDPTEHACQFDEEKFHKSKATNERDRLIDAGVCDACQLFGCTGWARRFRLLVLDTTNPQGPDGRIQPTGKRFKQNSSTDRPSWYFRQGRGGETTLLILPLHKEFEPIIILGLLKLIEQWAGLGAKTQLGYGQIKIQKVNVSDSEYTFSPDNFVKHLANLAATQPPTQPDEKNRDLPNLQEMFFAQVQTRDRGITATLNLRYDVRAKFRTAFTNNQKLRHWVCGTVSGDREASKIFFSQEVNGVMRVWGWIPELPKQFSGVSRDQILREIHATIQDFGNIVSWREFDSDRDTVGKKSDSKAFLRSLLEEK